MESLESSILAMKNEISLTARKKATKILPTKLKEKLHKKQLEIKRLWKAVEELEYFKKKIFFLLEKDIKRIIAETLGAVNILQLEKSQNWASEEKNLLILARKNLYILNETVNNLLYDWEKMAKKNSQH